MSQGIVVEPVVCEVNKNDSHSSDKSNITGLSSTYRKRNVRKNMKTTSVSGDNNSNSNNVNSMNNSNQNSNKDSNKEMGNEKFLQLFYSNPVDPFHIIASHQI